MRGKDWLRMLTMRASHDMVYIGQQDHLTVLWTSARGLPRMDAMKAFRDVILLRENVELK
jgi:hypothetical protein